MTDDLVRRLRAETDGATVNPDGVEAAERIEQLEQQITGLASVVGELLDEDAAERIEALEVEVQRLTKKCDMQAMILRRLTPENHPDTLFIHGTLGEKDSNGMPEKLMVVPAYGVDFSYIYEYTGKTTGPEW